MDDRIVTPTTAHDFADAALHDRVIPVTRTLFADMDTPVSIYRKMTGSRPGSFLLESAEQGTWSRFSFVGVSSFGVLTQDGDDAVWLDYGLDAERALGTADLPSPLESVALLYSRWRVPARHDTAPLINGLVGFIGWDAVREIEYLPNRPASDYDVPGQALCMIADLVIIDHHLGTVTLVANVVNDGVDSVDTMWAAATERLDAMQRDLEHHTTETVWHVDFDRAMHATDRTDDADYRHAVSVAKEHIRAGDVFQVVLSRRFDVECTANPCDVYRVLRTLNPSPYMYLLSLETPGSVPYSIVGSSPEAQITIHDRRVVTHPIAGSRPRGETPETDRAYEHDLLRDEKECAEHLMLVDLARNDLSKVCVPGSLEVTEFMRVHRFSHIMHIVSTVEGDLRESVDPVEVFRATFPAGTLSGAPKPRALEIIDDLEPTGRGVYAGVVGYLDFAGDVDLAIAIRTALISGGVARVQAGAGLVYDSEPQRELEECANKAAAPLRAVAIANTMRPAL